MYTLTGLYRGPELRQSSLKNGSNRGNGGNKAIARRAGGSAARYGEYLEWEPATYSRRAVPRSAARSAPLMAPLGAPSVFFRGLCGLSGATAACLAPRTIPSIFPGTTCSNRFTAGLVWDQTVWDGQSRNPESGLSWSCGLFPGCRRYRHRTMGSARTYALTVVASGEGPAPQGHRPVLPESK
jgi:hypothetical protein